MALPCSLTSIAVFLLANWLKFFSAASKSWLTACNRPSRKIRSRRAEDVLNSATRRVSSSTYACVIARSEEHTSALQSHLISYAVLFLVKKKYLSLDVPAVL